MSNLSVFHYLVLWFGVLYFCTTPNQRSQWEKGGFPKETGRQQICHVDTFVPGERRVEKQQLGGGVMLAGLGIQFSNTFLS